MALAFIVYFFLLFSTWYYALRAKRSWYIRNIAGLYGIELNHSILNYLIPGILFSLIIGMRYAVGVDYFNYLENYLFQYGVTERENIEPGFYFLSWVLKTLQLHYSFLFISCAAIIFGFFYARANDYPYLLPYLVVFFFTTGIVFHANNIIRHVMAFSIYFYALRFISRKSLFYYLLFTLIAASIHKSFILFLPLYFILSIDWFKYKWLQYILLILPVLFSSEVNNFILSFSSDIFNYLGYGNYIEKIEGYDRDIEGIKKGLGVLNTTAKVIPFVIAFLSDKIKTYFKRTDFVIYYNLYMIGQIVFPIVEGSIILERMIYSFYFFRFVVFAFTAYFLINNYKNEIVMQGVAYLIILVYVSSFIIGIFTSVSMCSPYQFFFTN